MMNTSDERITGLSDEALNPAPAQEAAVCTCMVCVACTVSDEALDAPVQHAFVCGGPLCYVSDEALDPAPAHEAAACTCLPPCYVSDEELAAR